MSGNLLTISNAIQKAYAITLKYSKILVSISGGADSDVMLDLLCRTVDKSKMVFAFFDTGIEYTATKEHLDEIEKKYDIKIGRVRASVPVPLGCKKYGLPFLSKDISAKINSLQNNNFDFEKDGALPYEELIAKYPKCKSSIDWWCNKKPKGFGINANSYLKEFIIENPPKFKISERCCEGAKKEPSKKYEAENKCDLKCLGLRKAEGGIRTSKYKSCYEYDGTKEMQNFRPIWNFTDEDKKTYCSMYGVSHSRCYTEYEFKRTGCAGCPFNSMFEDDLKTIAKYEPLLYQAVNNIFGASYDYTRQYREYKKEKKRNGQMSMFD